MAQAIKGGKTADQIKKDGLLAKFAEFGEGFKKTDPWVDVLYADVTKPPSTPH